MKSKSTISTANTQELWEKDRKHFIHPYTNYQNFHTEGSVIYSEGKDHFVFDHDGRKYLDGIAGLWCVNIGHGREEMADYLGQQARRLAYYNTFGDASSPPSAELAAKLAQICPGDLNHVFFGTGGSVANDTAIKIVHYYFNMLGQPNKKKIISRQLAYHGSTYLAHALTGIASTHLGFDLPKDLVHYVSAPYSYQRPDGMSQEDFTNFLITELEEKILELGAEQVAAFIAEPILGAGGVIVPPPGYHQRTAEICRKYGVLYISDEVITGFGRLGEMIASKEIFGLQPDILVLAKGISSGYVPLGATVISDRIHDVIAKPKKNNPYFTHGFTYSGHALACGAGLKNIEIMEREDLCAQVRSLGPYFEEQLKKLEDLPIVAEVRGRHYMLALEYVRDKTSKTLFDDSVAIGKRVYYHCKDRGLILRPIGNKNILSPPLTYDRSAIDDTVEILRSSILATVDDLKKEKLI